MLGFHLTTIGRKVNQYDSEALTEAMKRLGLWSVEGSQAADLAVLDTCCVTVCRRISACQTNGSWSPETGMTLKPSLKQIEPILGGTMRRDILARARRLREI
jgi:tRNA A37 methylthiotransferase MiaB